MKEIEIQGYAWTPTLHLRWLQYDKVMVAKNDRSSFNGEAIAVYCKKLQQQHINGLGHVKWVDIETEIE